MNVCPFSISSLIFAKDPNEISFRQRTFIKPMIMIQNEVTQVHHPNSTARKPVSAIGKTKLIDNHFESRMFTENRTPSPPYQRHRCCLSIVRRCLIIRLIFIVFMYIPRCFIPQINQFRHLELRPDMPQIQERTISIPFLTHRYEGSSIQIAFVQESLLYGMDS